MCGITGVWSNRPLGQAAEIEARMRLMAGKLGHRGPDNSGAWSDGTVGLGHTRLAVIDLSAAGHQPMTDVTGAFRIVFNGEIYNFPSLRKLLIESGHRFRSRSDTEVILNGYRQWGDAVVHHLNGMFAFALWDADRRRLLLARDRIGKKPLYFVKFNDILVFGSEIKSILAWPGITSDPDFEAIHHYLSFRNVPAPRTAYAGIKPLQPGH